MYINVVQIGGGAFEEAIPERSKMNVRIGEEEEGDLELRVF